MKYPHLPDNISQLELETQLRELEKVLGPIGDTEGEMERRSSQALSIILRVKQDLVRVETINGKSIVFGKK